MILVLPLLVERGLERDIAEGDCCNEADQEHSDEDLPLDPGQRILVVLEMKRVKGREIKR